MAGETVGEPQTMLRPLPADRIRVWPVSRTVNNVRNDSPNLLEPHVVRELEPALL